MNIIYTLNKYFRFSANEIRQLLISVFFVSLIFSYDQWGYETFDLIIGLQNFFNALLIIGLAFLVHQTAQKVMALYRGYKATFQMWGKGLAAGIVLAVLSFGKLLFLAPGSVKIDTIPLLRVGQQRHMLKFNDLAIITFMGPLANIVLAIIFKALIPIMGGTLLAQAMMWNMWIAVFSMLPLPPLDGGKIFFGSRLLYTFTAGFTIGCALLISLAPIISTLIGAAILGVIILGIIYYEYELK